MLMKKSITSHTLRIFSFLLFCYLFVISCPQTILAEEDNADQVPDRYGLATVIGYNYDPSENIVFGLISGFALYDYDKIWPHAAPEALRFKVEVSAGATLKNEKGAIVSAGFLALYYLDTLTGQDFRPYIEGGIGGIFTQWRVDGQGSKFNFNPQIGLGTEFSIGSGPPFLAALRLHHISNAGLDEDNRGVNSVVFVIGRFF
ncbi:MAG: acyloxyacyl hydrolase [Desulfobacterales bacterium]|nr:acyloxyacyl hydrolase [Desulfobacterales bacterium]